MSAVRGADVGEWYRALFRNGSDAVLVLDGDGRVVEANRKAERQLDAHEGDLVGRSFRELQGETDEGPLQRASTGGLRYETELRTVAGRTVPVEVSLAILPWSGEGRLYCAFRDITERLRAQAEIRELNRTLEARVQQRTEQVRRQAAELARTVAELEQFTQAAGHDLRAPLRAIRNLAEWVSEDLGDEAPLGVREQLELLCERVRRLEGLLDGLLAWARIGREPDPEEPLRLRELATEVRYLLDPEARLELEWVGSDEAFVLPRIAVQQVLVNLISNAIRHHGAGVVGVRVAWSREDEALRIDVDDDGPGIEPRFRESVFEMFRQLRPADEIGGSGVGLALVRKILESRGGRATIGDRPGGGCRVTTVWPLGAVVDGAARNEGADPRQAAS